MDDLTYRPRGNLIWGGSALILDALFLLQAVFYPTGDSLGLDLAIGALVAVASVLIWLRPKLVLQAESLDVVNPLTRVTISYRDIDELDTKWTLRIRHGGESTRVWVAPTNGKHRWIADSTFRWGASKLPVSDAAEAGSAKPISESHLSDSGVAADLIRQRLKGLH